MFLVTSCYEDSKEVPYSVKGRELTLQDERLSASEVGPCSI
jgi:hypothetical protein